MLEHQVFFSARELAEIAKTKGMNTFPWSERAAQRLAKREGWNDLPSSRCRKREGRKGGGGLEYHSCILPDDLMGAIALLDTQAQQRRALAVQEDVDRGQPARRGATTLNARHRTVMQYRSTVLLAIERYKIQRGHTLGHAIRDFVEAQNSYVAWGAAETARDDDLSLAQVALLRAEPVLNAADGFGITPDALVIANDRPRDTIKISRSTLYEWFKARKQGGISMLAPAPTKEAKRLPAGFATFLKYYAMPQKPDVTEALKEYHKHHADQPLTLDQVRYTLKTKLNNIERNVGREGLLTLRSRLAYIQRSTENLFPTTVYVADGKTFDAEIADWKTNRPMKPELTSIMDTATRKCVGIAISRIRGISDIQSLPTILVGMGKLRDNLRRFPQIESRAPRKVEFLPATIEDTRALMVARCEVPVAEDMVAFVWKVSKGYNREILEAIAHVERAGLRLDPGETGITMADMAGQIIMNDRDTGKPILVPEVT